MDYELLGQRIRAARLAAGLSQEQLAEMVGLTSKHISHTEVATTKISLPTLVKIANALHTSVVNLRIRFSLDNLKLDGDVLNIPLFMADQTDRLIGMELEAL